ncbi:hypothetical protein vseg_013162 [Gypsophila vaccaria]
MAILSGLGLVLTIVFGCLLLALVAELYYLLWWKKQRITSCNSNNSNNSISHGHDSSSIELDYSNHTKEMFYLFCWDKPTSVTTTLNNDPGLAVANKNNGHGPDLESGGVGNNNVVKDQEGVDVELMRLHNLVGPPRFLFTIKEESKEDLESEDEVFKSRKNDVNNNNNNNYDNPLYEGNVENELSRMRWSSSSSPPPKFKFMRDAEEKLYRKLVEEAKRRGVVLDEGILDNSHVHSFVA